MAHKALGFISHGIFLLFFSVLAGCASLTMPAAPRNENISWSNRLVSLSSIHTWQIQGEMGIRTANEANSASIEWKQNLNDYTLSLYGPLGSANFTLTGSADSVTLKTPQGKVFHADSAEALLKETTGWDLPVSDLYYWIRGIPAPKLPAKMRWDVYHRLSDLNQDQWKIHYLDYTSLEQSDLPRKIFIEGRGLQVKIVIQKWLP